MAGYPKELVSFTEKRAFHRMAVGCALEFRTAGSTTPEAGFVEDLSAVGIRFTSQREIEVGTRLSFTIHAGTDNRSLNADSVVVRCVATDDGYSVACNITAMD
jgi:hypothetical protein